MSPTNTALLRSLPSVKALLFFNTVAKHLNLVRAGQELHITQGALSRQLKALEEHLGVELFKRGPRGLLFTQEGELLYDYSRRAFDTLGTGLRRLSVDVDRDALVVSVARSFASCVLCKRVSSFAKANPWIDLQIDVHRYYADMDSSGADISIRLGAGDWEGYRMLALTDDRIGAVCSPHLARQYEKLGPSNGLKEGILLRNVERDYWEKWRDSGNRTIDLNGAPTIRFNESAPMLEVAKSGAGLCLTRLTLVSDALADGSLKQLWRQELRDGLKYFAVCSNRTTARRAVDLFMQWLASEFVTSTGTDLSIPQIRKV
jgi:LysR family glycine cleavage system transcriptional activator